jgi:regulatory protein
MGQAITMLKVQKRNRARVNVYLDGEYAFAVSALAAARLQTGQELTEAEIAALRHGGTVDLAYHQAIRYLSFRPRSQSETCTYLVKKGYDTTLVTAVVERLLVGGYLDDEEFARFWVENRSRFRPRSAHALRYELRQKGVSATIIDEALSDLDESEIAWKAVEGKLSRWDSLERRELEHKVMAHLGRRGFSYAIARHVAERAWYQISDGHGN